MGHKTIDFEFTKMSNRSMMYRHESQYGSTSVCINGVRQFFDVPRKKSFTFRVYGAKPSGTRYHRLKRRAKVGWILADVDYFGFHERVLPGGLDHLLDHAFRRRRNLYVSLHA